jgi:hypothetical protein
MLATAEHAVQVSRVVARARGTTSSHRLEQALVLAFLLGIVMLLPVFDQSAFAPERGSYLIEIRARRYWQLSRPRLELFDDARLGLWAMVAFGVRRWSLTTLTHDKLPRR